MPRAYYQQTIEVFLASNPLEILGALTEASTFAVGLAQRAAWEEQIRLLQKALPSYAGRGSILFEYIIPRLGRRIDAVLLIDHIAFVLEFKVGADNFSTQALEQVWDYALDLKNFHEPSHQAIVVPLLIATDTEIGAPQSTKYDSDHVFRPIAIAPTALEQTIQQCLASIKALPIAAEAWAAGRYSPTPTIIEAARALYRGHAVSEISRSDAGARNLQVTSEYVRRVIEDARTHSKKAVCLLTGVPGAGKTLVGLDIATTRIDDGGKAHGVYLSGNGPLVAVLREALARDHIDREAFEGRTLRKGAARRKVEGFIQNVHHFRDACLASPTAPADHVAIFDEAQRAWTREQTSSFMRRKKGHANFDESEPEYLISCMDRHPDWAVVLCLIGGGQEINTGEAGISEWLSALRMRFTDWEVHLSPRLRDSEYDSARELERFHQRPKVFFSEDLHLAVSMRSFRAERVSEWVKFVLDLDDASAKQALQELLPRYPIAITRNLNRAKEWIRERARGGERYGLMVSSEAQRLRPHAIDVRAPVDPVHWFLAPRSDIRSSWFMEDAATEFQVQGLELDWGCVVWDADLRIQRGKWDHWSFVGAEWQRIRKEDRQMFHTNAYRVLLTRARQGMVIAIPEGDPADYTRSPEFFDTTYRYLRSIGIPEA